MPPSRLLFASLFVVAACRDSSTAAAPPPSPPPAVAPDAAAPPPPVRSPLTLTYLGVAGWSIEADGHTIVVDPYLSRPDLKGAVISDAAAVAARTPPKVDAIVIGHSHVDHLLDAPTMAKATGAQLIGSATSIAYAQASGVPAAQLVPVRGGEDYQFDGFSIRVLPSLHSALDDKHTLGTARTTPPPRPMTFDDFVEGGTFAYLVRVGGHEVFVLSTANYIERELVGLRPDVAIVATGLRQEIHDYTCRLLRAIGAPPRVFTTHFDDWQGPPIDEPIDEDLQAFIAEVTACAPGTVATVPGHFKPIVVP